MITIKKLQDITKDDLDRIMKRSGDILDSIYETVKVIMADVKENGDAALRQYTEKFDGAKLDALQVTREEIEYAYTQVTPEFIEGFKQAMANSRKFESNAKPVEGKTITEEGIEVWREWRPIERVGLYIPGGKAFYPSCLLMTAIPAQIAGCKEFVVCTPPDKTGRAPASTLVACDLAGVQQIYKIGGAQAVAAMTYGTETVPQVYKIFGAGNTWVTAAKMLAFGTVDIDMPAGPSEIMILADETANPKFMAADLLSQSEHAEDSASVLVTTSAKLAKQVDSEVVRQMAYLSSRDTIEKSLGRYGMIVLVETLEQGAKFVNDYAPEHLEIVTQDDAKYLGMINNVGSVFLGNYSTEPAGDYASGSNHVLPTNGYARMFSPLSTESFGRKIQVQKLSKDGLGKIRNAIKALAETEGLPAHKNASEVRFEE
ncbi:histidinol dehydrogenase [Candidatus Wirthbacteria bacterium CG2_30_54_11]|uniref:Histidinol dehydrogenase n=1 Tax=Candidatus Wirthbacteria bacterium CG2_30_54_11 TaxID=1817892 RepID=A0A1J5II24_9BACT|nr:MAG: histidinol dehydrogenase [Candidatus Wirthbacteria bacterium CG2_30_54_11]